MATYQIDTEDGGVYEVDVEESGQEQPKEKGLMGKALDVLNTPARGMAGLAVGAERLLRPIEGLSMLPGGSISANQVSDMVQGAPNALQRASAATKPDFEPEDLREQLMSEGAQAATNAVLGEGVGAMAVKGLPYLSKGLSKLKGTPKSGFKGMNPKQLEAELAKTTEEIAGATKYKTTELPTLKGKLLKTRALEKIEAKKAIKDYESQIEGYQFKGELPKYDKLDVQSFSQMSPQNLAKNNSLHELQVMYDRLKGAPMGTLDDVLKTRAMQNITKAQESLKPGIIAARKSYSESFSNVGDIKDSVLKEKMAVEEALLEAKQRQAQIKAALKEKESGPIRKSLKWMKRHPIASAGLSSLLGHKVSQFIR